MNFAHIFGNIIDKQDFSDGLYVVSTPIGNLGDITLRALAVLSRATVIACEDTRVTRKLLSAYGLRVRLVSYHQHNEAQKIPQILSMIRQGGIVALVSDAGTPIISDPGQRLVRACVEADIAIYAIPGPSAVLAAVAVAGLPSEVFTFRGFLPPKSAARRAALAKLGDIETTLIFFETGHRLRACLADMRQCLGCRRIVIARELTKKFEQIYRGTIEDILDRQLGTVEVKGEVTIVVAPAATAENSLVDQLGQLLTEALADHSLVSAVDLVRTRTGLSRKIIYQKALSLAKPVTD